MELVVIVAVVIGVAWFAVPRLTSRRHADETLAEVELRGGGMMSWLPAWMLFGAMTHSDGKNSEAGSSGHDSSAGWGGDLGGGNDSGGGGGDFGGGGD